jgi:signal transduction histidine kinase
LSIVAVAGNFSPVDGLTHTPHVLVVTITILVVVAWIVFAFGIGYLVVRAEAGRQLLARRNAELMATELMLADSTRVGERLRISRELHDAMGHRLAALNIQLELASRLASESSAEAVAEARALAKLLLSEVREAVGELREKREVNLKQAIGILTRGMARPQVHLALDDGMDSLDPSIAHALFRCVQETITNAIKHSGATNLWIELSHNSSRWRLCVRDDGCGAKDMQEGNGIRGIRERIEEMGGKLEIETQPGSGFHLCGTIPTLEQAA